jgi:hypothetical protein
MKGQRMRLAKISIAALLLLVTGTASSTVRMVPPPLSQLAGAYVGSASGVSLQRLVLNADGSGTFDDVVYDARGNQLTRYHVKVRSRSVWRIDFELTPVEAGLKSLRLRGEADFFLMTLSISASERHRKHKLMLFREGTFQELLDFARNYSASDK